MYEELDLGRRNSTRDTKKNWICEIVFERGSFVAETVRPLDAGSKNSVETELTEIEKSNATDHGWIPFYNKMW